MGGCHCVVELGRVGCLPQPLLPLGREVWEASWVRILFSQWLMSTKESSFLSTMVSNTHSKKTWINTKSAQVHIPRIQF
jgi:hypothetical protein